jgi:hypothetical protein
VPEVQTASGAVAGPVTALIDPAVGGVLSTSDPALSVQFPPGAASDLLSLSLSAVDPTAAANIAVNGQLYALSVLDSAANPVTSFDQPVAMVVTPPSGSDPSALTISVLDSTTGTLQPLGTQIGDDGRVSVLVSSLAAPANLQPPPPPSDTPPPPSDTSPPPSDAAPTEPVVAPDGGGDAAPDALPPDPALDQASA